MGLAATEKRNRVAAELARLKQHKESLLAQVRQGTMGIIGGADGLRDEIAGDENFNEQDMAEIVGLKVDIAQTITDVAQELTAAIELPQE